MRKGGWIVYVLGLEGGSEWKVGFRIVVRGVRGLMGMWMSIKYGEGIVLWTC